MAWGGTGVPPVELQRPAGRRSHLEVGANARTAGNDENLRPGPPHGERSARGVAAREHWRVRHHHGAERVGEIDPHAPHGRARHAEYRPGRVPGTGPATALRPTAVPAPPRPHRFRLSGL